ncbi:hypothetical protein BIU82_16085 [Arthrobacter sp. SW1]|uniref:protein kinase domain-containing protein n=1 Tax=Arthrobacter sp. SW1 TaxID=1920889 RepID=UPI000877C2A7|nr:protein kinase [Arthrobacter sp. SW1]OFI38973.1 hypothetical protein BIU82_16085 [Arthrobacter sp. SW1]
MDTSASPQIPGYAAVRELGRGPSGPVWLAVSKDQRRQLAVKCFSGGSGAPRAWDEQAMSGVQREVRIFSRLQHEHLVRVHEAVRLTGAFEGMPGLLMDYAAGGSLEALLSARGKLSVGQTVTVITPLARAVAFLHQEGVVHAAITPGEVLFTAQGKPLLAGAGMARMLRGAAGEEGAGEGTSQEGARQEDAELRSANLFDDPAAASPPGIVRPERDCYSLAALAWYCLTGAPPERSSSRLPLTMLVPDVPAALAAVIEAGLEEDPAARPAAMAFGAAVYRSAAAAPLELPAGPHVALPEPAQPRGVLQGNRVRFRRPGKRQRRHASGREGRPTAARRRKALTAGIAALALVLPVSAGIWWSAVHEPQPAPAQDGAPIAAPALETPEPVTPSASRPPAAGEGLDDDMRARLRSDNPEEALVALSALRDSALRTGKLELLDSVNVKGSAAAAADAGIAAQMKKAGVVLAGFTTTLNNIRLIASTGDGEASVTAAVGTSRFDERNASGVLVRPRPAAAPQQLRLVLQRVEGAWRIADILAAGT